MVLMVIGHVNELLSNIIDSILTGPRTSNGYCGDVVLIPKAGALIATAVGCVKNMALFEDVMEAGACPLIEMASAWNSLFATTLLERVSRALDAVDVMVVNLIASLL